MENLMTSNTIEVWNIKSQNKEMAYIVADEFTNETVNSLMQYIRNNFPEECSKYDEDVLRNAILINLQNAEIENNTNLLTILLVVVQIGLCVVVIMTRQYVPTHWNIHGVADEYGSPFTL